MIARILGVVRVRDPRRKRVLVDPLQYRLLKITFVYFVTGFAVYAVMLFWPLMTQLNSNPGLLSPFEQRQLASLFLALNVRFWPALLVAFAVLALHSVFVSYRIAGPLYRFRQVFRSVTEGDLSGRVRIREGDYLQREADALDGMVASLRQRLGAIAESGREAERQLEVLRRTLGALESGAAGSQAAASADRLRRAIESIEAQVAGFELGEEGGDSRTQRGDARDDDRDAGAAGQEVARVA